MIKWEYLTIPSADMGEVNPLADIYNIEYIHAGYELSKNVQKDDLAYVGKGMINSILPYTIQDNFNRECKERKFKAIVLENEYLKATFIPELGARLWSLYDKEHDKELLYKNPVFQPANLAIRNAWFSGGVEFNVGIKGHNMLTCEPYFARIARTKNNQEVLQLYEYERVRGIAFGINAYLPQGSKILYLKDTVENLSNNETWNYWWSNIAVPDTKGTRVIAPANSSFMCTYDDGHYVVDKVAYPFNGNTDASYPINIPRALDFFFSIPKTAPERWVSAIPEDGIGLVQVSTKEMIGKKLFVWGQGDGGKNWANWLSDGSGGYIEIQSGLAYTQLEHIPFPANTTLSWTEGYTGIKCDLEKVFSTNYNVAVEEVKEKLHFNLKNDDVEQALKNAVPTDFVSYEVLSYGSGHAYVEELVRKKKVSNIYDFYPKSATNDQEIWLKLLYDGYLIEKDVCDYPTSYVIGNNWLNLLEKSVKTEKGNNWHAWYHIGVIKYQLGDFDGAKNAFIKSASIKENAWSLRNLAMIENHNKNYSLAVEYIDKAIPLAKDLTNIYIDALKIRLDGKMYNDVISAYSNFPKHAKDRARIKLQLAIAYLNTGCYEKARQIINAGFVMYDIREGEVSISHLWQDLYKNIVMEENPNLSEEQAKKTQQEKYPLPKKLDFRMH